MFVGLLLTLIFSWFNLRVRIRNRIPFITPAWVGYGAELLILTVLSLLKRDIYISGGLIVALAMLILADIIDEKREELVPVINANITAIVVIAIFIFMS